MEKVCISYNFHGLPKWRNLLASLDYNIKCGGKKEVYIFETYWRASIITISERIFLKENKVFDYGEGMKNMLELNPGREWRDSEIPKLVLVVDCEV